MKELLESTKYQESKIRVLLDFLKQEKKFEQAEIFEKMRFVGYVLDISYDKATIITSDPYKKLVGGIPRNSLLVMIPDSFEELPPHFTVLRVLEAAATPLKQEVQQTYFELQKSSMPELDVFTQSELQWGALKTDVIGMFYPNPEKLNEIEFSGDINNFVSAHMYRVYSPNKELLDLIINSLVEIENSFSIGKLRLTECRLNHKICEFSDLDVMISPRDFIATRTAMFGKTRLGKSNIVKIIAESLIKTLNHEYNIGQLVFDINGEYANDNPQDDNFSLASAYPDVCHVYALTKKDKTKSKPLKLNFYEHTERSHKILGKLLQTYGKDGSNYVKSFISIDIPSIDFLMNNPDIDRNEFNRALRRVLMYWAILNKAGFEVKETISNEINRKYSDKVKGEPKFRFTIDPGYKADLRKKLYKDTPPKINNFKQLINEFEKIAVLLRKTKDDDPVIYSSNGNPLFESDEKALLNFLYPSIGTGPGYIIPFRDYHDKNADEFIIEILNLLNIGKTVILDLGNAHPELMSFYSEQLSREIFMNQVDKFSNNRLGNDYIQLYFEEAHNLFPNNQNSDDIYLRIAKEGAKYQIGMIYSTQSVTTINSDLLAQTENFFIAHMSSKSEVNRLASVNSSFEGLQDDILRSKTIGYIRVLTRSHRFVIPVQARKFGLKILEGDI